MSFLDKFVVVHVVAHAKTTEVSELAALELVAFAFAVVFEAVGYARGLAVRPLIPRAAFSSFAGLPFHPFEAVDALILLRGFSLGESLAGLSQGRLDLSLEGFGLSFLGLHKEVLQLVNLLLDIVSLHGVDFVHELLFVMLS
jgi:hypothetical protein